MNLSVAPSPTRARRRMGLRRAARIEFPAIEIVGGLMTPAILARIAAASAPGQDESGYGIPPGLKLRDEAARAYRIAEAHWTRFLSTGSSAQFVLALLKDCFGFTVSAVPPVSIDDRTFPIGHATLDGRLPVVIAPAGADGERPGIDESVVEFGDGARRRSATLLVQEYLNASDPALWGLACDGRVLRLLRDNASLTRPAWIEADLAKIFTEGLFADFTALWLLIHASRFGPAQSPSSDCALERWREDGRKEGVAARELLAGNVEKALEELGQGFIEDPANRALRDALSTGALSPQAYYEELLRFVYRLIFLFAAEDRGLLHAPDAVARAREIYEQGYSLNRLRERCLHRASWDKHADVWDSLKIVFRALERGEPRLALPALGGLFQSDQLNDLASARISNRRLLAALWRLAWLRPGGAALARVNWRDMETEELGSVYESLLELTPRVDAVAGAFAFAGEDTGGHARKTTGSYYTPDALVKLLLDTTLDPVLDAAEARNSADPVSEILKLTIIDPACGSGHFLLGAARRAAGRIAKLRSPGAPSKAEFQHALREVVSHSIYGVDRNPMAVDLCKVALWVEAVEPGKPLTFLDARIKCGDSLIGVFDIAGLKDGIPDAAYAALSGDAKDVAKAYARLNREQRAGAAQGGLFSEFCAPRSLIDAAQRMSAMSEETAVDVAAKRAAYNRLHGPGGWQHLKSACDLYVMAFFAPKTGPVPTHEQILKPSVPLTEHLWTAARGASVYGPLVAAADMAAQRVRAFHWPLEFPEVFARGGFDAVVGNPPWERVKLQEKEFFAARDPEIAKARNASERRKLIEARGTQPQGTRERTLYEDFLFARREAEAVSEFVRECGRYALTGVGDVNTYALFAEHFYQSTRTEGRSGIIVPTGIATDSSTSSFFGALVERNRLAQIVGFENEAFIFPGVHHAFKFSVLSIGAPPGGAARFAFTLRHFEQLNEEQRFFSLTADQIAKINPNTRTAPVFRSQADAELTAKLYSRAPVLIDESASGTGNPWSITFQAMFHMSGDSELFATASGLASAGFQRDGVDWVGADGTDRRVPLYEAKMIHHFDHRWATYEASANDEDASRDVTLAEKQSPDFEPAPRYWVPQSEVELRASRVPAGLKSAVRDEDSQACLKVLAVWLLGHIEATEGRALREDELGAILGHHGWQGILNANPSRWAMEQKTKSAAADMQVAVPLSAEDVTFLREGPDDGLDLARAMIARKQPRWLMGWRDITNATNERTVIASVLPKVGVNHKTPLLFSNKNVRQSSVLLALLSSLILDYAARQKLGGTSLTYSYFKQFPVVGPNSFTAPDLDFVVPRVIELTYTSSYLRLWAQDLGCTSAPFTLDESRRALLRADLDAFFARKYGLSRDELRYVLDPSEVKGPDYPTETFRVLKKNEIAKYGEYRTQRLVLEAFDRLTRV